MKITVQRIASRDDGTFGVLFAGDLPFALTCERPWLSNQPQVSCIPVGLYKCRRYSSARFPSTWQVMDVPGRSAILFHCGNVATDSAGCIIIGGRFEVIGKVCGLVQSAEEFREFMARTAHLEEFELVISTAQVGASNNNP